MVGMTSTAADAPRSPGRPRSVRADEAIIDAVLDLLADGQTMEALSIEAIAARAGVGKATIYRRWPGKDALLRDALRTLKGAPPVPAGHSVREDLITLLSSVGSGNRDARAMKIMPCLVPEVHRSPEQHRLYEEMIEPRRQVMREVLRRGIDAGELRADLDVDVCMMMTGPMLMQKLLRWRPDIDERELAERVVTAVWGGMATGPARP
ncbi:TetR/AcrR family transcriptional regulator [Plantactinospora siamensis]|uniref:TetR/AcrR family transcriptional regulator n=1 Tax=Plantactinospora siamensis TaxID=555372 RepID=A0ABV6P1D1_9ACTN